MHDGPVNRVEEAWTRTLCRGTRSHIQGRDKEEKLRPKLKPHKPATRFSESHECEPVSNNYSRRAQPRCSASRGVMTGPVLLHITASLKRHLDALVCEVFPTANVNKDNQDY